MVNTYLGLGTNLGNRVLNLERAIALINRLIGRITRSSSVYETEPWGFTAEQHFLNMVLEVETKLKPEELIKKILNAESLLGRKREETQYVSRVIDIDILLYSNEIANRADLKIPHPRMHQRKFVMIPMCEIAPDIVHPVFNRTMTELLALCNDQNSINKLEDLHPSA